MALKSLYPLVLWLPHQHLNNIKIAMQFLVVGKEAQTWQQWRDGSPCAKQHLQLGDALEAAGNRWYGCVLLDDAGQMIGSMAVMDFPSKTELNEWLAIEPYVTGKVWQTIEITKCNVKTP